jgi:hypothetical protein
MTMTNDTEIKLDLLTAALLDIDGTLGDKPEPTISDLSDEQVAYFAVATAHAHEHPHEAGRWGRSTELWYDEAQEEFDRRFSEQGRVDFWAYWARIDATSWDVVIETHRNPWLAMQLLRERFGQGKPRIYSIAGERRQEEGDRWERKFWG